MQPTKDSAGRKSGTSGVYCSATDFVSLFNITCDRPTSDVYLCKFPLSCSSQLLPSLYSRFGAEMLPAQSAAGKTVASCAWDPWHIGECVCAPAGRGVRPPSVLWSERLTAFNPLNGR